jgi:hypothetical protein
MIRKRLALLLVAAGCVYAGTAATAAAQDAPPIPEGYIAYIIQGEGISAPPIPLKVEDDRITSPPDGFVTVTESSIEGDRARFSMDTPVGPASFIGHKRGDAFVGFVFFVEDGNSVSTPVAFAPEGQEVEVVPDLVDLGRSASISRVEIVPGEVSVKAGESRRFVVRAFDASGKEIQPQRVEWYSSGGKISPEGEFVGINPAPRRVVALIDSEVVAMTTVTVTEADVVDLTVFTDVPSRLAVGSRVPLEFDAINAVHRWELEPDFELSSSDPSVVATEGTALAALEPGRATVTLSAGEARKTFEVEVVGAGSGAFRITGAPTGPIKTGEVVPLGTTVADAHPAWSVVEPGADVWPESDFVAEQPGTYIVTATLGQRVATARIEVEPREVSGRFHVVGRGLNPGMFTADIWPQNNYVYLGTHQANQIRTYDVSDPANPVLTDSVTVDARVINSVKVSRNGKWLAATREGAANRRNGIVIYSLDDPAHPRQVSEYTETVTSGVHNVFWATDSILYLTNDGTGDMNILDVSDPANPKEIGRWGLPVEGKTLHDIWAQDGLLWMSYMRDGLVIADIGGGGQGGTPAKPVMLSRIFYPGGPTHNAFRSGDYLFVGDEDFSSVSGTKPSLPAGLSADPRGEVHIIDVSDPARPRYAARYELPEAGAHNLWVQDDVMYVGFYQGGIRAVDVSGKLRGDLYRQGREIAHFLPQGPPEDAKLPYAPMTWGVFPMFENGWKPTGDVWFVTDYNSGLWAMKLEITRPERPIS